MSDSNSVVPMDSYRLAQYAVQVPCYVCDGGNSIDAELCRHCYAPMALAHQANSQDLRPQMVAVIGSSGAGKTVYLGMLMDMLSRRNDRLDMLSRGAFSITLQQVTVGSLTQCRFPDKTPSEPDRWNWVHFQVRAKNRPTPAELIIPDMAGEAILEEIEHPRSYPVIRSFLSNCCGVMVLVDAAKITEGGQDQDFFAMKLVSYLSELKDDRNSKKNQGKDIPLAITFTKADESDICFDDPTGFAEKYSPGLWRHCQERFSIHRYFAAGVAGACGQRSEVGNGRIRVPLRVEPRGIIEPFQWLIENIE